MMSEWDLASGMDHDTYTMSGQVAVSAYIMDPTAVRYRIFFIHIFSSSLVGERSSGIMVCGSSGVVAGCAS